jgi:hypothetical protein
MGCALEGAGMKRLRTRNAIMVLASLLALGAAVWLWFELMEQVWEPQLRYSPDLGRKPMLAATQLLERHGYQVDVYKLLGDADLDTLPDGALILADNRGRMSDAQARQLLAWVRRGNTLVMQPRWSDDDERNEQRSNPRAPRKPRLNRLDTDDPLGALVGVTMGYARDMRDSCDTGIAPPRRHTTGQDEDEDDNGDSGAYDGEYQFTCVTVPGARYPLVLETGHEVLASQKNARAPLWSDPDAVALRAYGEGDGRLVMVSDNFFNNARLPRYDHGEMLLALAALRPGARHVVIVQDLNITPWYVALWRAGAMPLTALALLAALLLWRAARHGRFGPLLPEPAVMRRALLEHVEASGHWLWRAPGGRALLLDAARRETLALLARRAPDLRHLDRQALCARLARLHQLDETALHEALYNAPQSADSRHPAIFVRQIRVLQQVRKAYDHTERQ